jgi:murein DD-endopeptidase MepM/ murein hydrolase activator NlpD
MPHRTSSHHRAAHHSLAAGHARAAARHPDADYTFRHAGRQVRLGPVAFWIVVGTLVIMAAWTAVTATYFAFKDDVLTRLIARQAEMQFAYEDRIAEMRTQVDRVTSRQLLDQEQFEQKLDQILRRQAVLESRATMLGAVADPTTTGSVPSSRRVPTAETGDGKLKPSPISDTVIFVVPPDREARLESRFIAPGAEGSAQRAGGTGIGGAIARLSTSLDRVEARQSIALNAYEEKFDSKIKRMRRVLSELGLDPAKIQASAPTSGIGGPFVAARPASNSATAFERQLYRIHLARVQADRLSHTMAYVPLRKPLPGEIDLSSGYGMRVDPFIRAWAMHTGLDFRGSTGDPVYATAAGTVALAGPNGGYGKMVEIDHGNGLSTRYGHLSAIAVSAGQRVKAGQLVGRVGSTGRSTGPHLHYETRVDGEAVDPQKFLRAGIRLGSTG